MNTKNSKLSSQASSALNSQRSENNDKKASGKKLQTQLTTNTKLKPIPMASQKKESDPIVKGPAAASKLIKTA